MGYWTKKIWGAGALKLEVDHLCLRFPSRMASASGIG
jgi:hypothetical protein